MSQEKPQNPILKAHLEGVEMFEKRFKEDFDYIRDKLGSSAVRLDIKSFLTTYAINILKAAKEAGQKKYTFKEVEYEEGVTVTEPVEDETKSLSYAQGFNACHDSIHSAIDEGIKEISN